jgi:TP901 family phage tail tape measure protein
MLAEAIEVLATITGIDLVSDVLKGVDASFDAMSETAQAAAAAAEEAAAKIDASLLSTASGENAVTIATAQVDASRAELSVATTKQAAAERALIQAQQDASAAASGDTAAQKRLIEASTKLADAQKVAATAASDMEEAQQRLAATVDATTGASIAAAREAAIAADEQEAAAAKTGEANEASSEKVKNAAFIAAAVVAGIGYEAVKSAMNFQTLTTRLVTTAGESQSALGTVRNGILQVSDQTGVSASDLATSMYVVESAGFDAAKGGIDVLRASTEGAATEGANFADVANAVTDILKDYHHAGSDAANVTSQLTAAVSVGKANFQTMSSAMGNVLPLAAAVGLKFNDVAGTLSEMTSHGVTAQRASQNLATAIRSLEKPTTVMQAEFKATGITTDELNQHMSSEGLGGTLEWLSQVAAANAPKLHQTYTGALGSLVGTAAGLNVALETTGKNAHDTATDIATIGKASADANGNVKGFSDLQQTTAFQLDRAKVAIENVGIALGTALLPMVTALAKDVSNIIGPMISWISTHRQLAITIFETVGALVAIFGAIKAVITITELLDGAMTLLEENPVVAAIALITLALVLLYTHSKTARDILNDIGEFLGKVLAADFHLISNVVNWFAKNVLPGLEDAIKDVINWFTAHKQDFVDAWDDMAKAVQSVVNWFNSNVLTWIKARIADLTQWWSQNGQQIKEVWSVIWKAIALAVLVAWDTSIKPTITVIMSVWSYAWKTIKDIFEVYWSIVSSVLSAVMHNILNSISVVLDLITGKWGKAWQDVKKLVSQGLGDVVTIIKNVVSGFGTLLYDAGANLIGGLISGIESAVGNLSSTASSIASTIRSYFPFSPAKRGPLSGSGSPQLAGAKIGNMVAEGLQSSTGAVGAAAKAAAQMAAKSLSSGGFTIGASGQIGVSGLSFTPGAVGLSGGGGASQVNITLDMRGSQVMSDRDMDMLSQKIEKRLATVILPSGGYRSRF